VASFLEASNKFFFALFTTQIRLTSIDNLSKRESSWNQ
jgi:hypothetical protein